MHEEEFQTVYETHKATHDNAMKEAEAIRENYKVFESEMNSKLNELKTLKTQEKMAKLKENIILSMQSMHLKTIKLEI